MGKSVVIFTVNPGSTTTKCALFYLKEDKIDSIIEETIEHSVKEISQFPSICDQIIFREKAARHFIKKYLPPGNEIIACAGRGGMLTPVPSGAIKINEELVNFSLFTPVYQHASNLGAPLAYRIAQYYNVPAFIVDPVSVDEFSPIARISGCPDFPRFSFVHALNIRATVRKFATEIGKDFNEIRCVVAHLGGGFSIAAIDHGKIVDNDNRMESAPFTPERAGGIPPIPLLEACFSGKYKKEELLLKLYGEGGVYAYLGSKNMVELEKKAKQGDKKVQKVYYALIYQIGKEIAAMASVLDFEIDGIIITGGLARDQFLINGLERKINKLGNIYLYPGSNENEALAETVARVLTGKENFLNWPVKSRNSEEINSD
jgi:butyrate kinase